MGPTRLFQPPDCPKQCVLVLSLYKPIFFRETVLPISKKALWLGCRELSYLDTENMFEICQVSKEAECRMVNLQYMVEKRGNSDDAKEEIVMSTPRIQDSNNGESYLASL